MHRKAPLSWLHHIAYFRSALGSDTNKVCDVTTQQETRASSLSSLIPLSSGHTADSSPHVWMQPHTPSYNFQASRQSGHKGSRHTERHKLLRLIRDSAHTEKTKQEEEGRVVFALHRSAAGPQLQRAYLWCVWLTNRIHLRKVTSL